MFFILTHIFQWLQCMKQFIFMFFSSVWMWSINMFFNRSGNISIKQLSFTMAVTFWVLIFSWCKISNKGAVWFMYCNAQVDKERKYVQSFLKIFHISFKRGFMCPSSAFSQYLYVVASWLPFFTNFYNYFFLIFSYFIQKGLLN